MNLLRLITLPYVRRHLWRTLLTIVGIALGVAAFLAMRIADQSVVTGFRTTIARLAGRAELQISAGEAGVPEDLLEQVQSLHDVKVAVPVVEAVVQTGFRGEGNLLVLAVDMVGDTNFRDYSLEEDADGVVSDPLVFLAQPDSIILTRDFAERNGFARNSRLTMQTMDGVKTFTVRGLLRGGGMASVYGGNLAIMDVYAAQKVFGRGRWFDRIDVVVAPGTDVQAAQRAISLTVGPAFAVERPQSRSQTFEALLAGYSAFTRVTSLFALLIGMFVVYNSFATAVVQRRTEIGTLRALGATRGRIRNLFLAESAVAGALGAAAGLWVGSLSAQLMSHGMARLASALSGSEQTTELALVSRELLLSATGMGILTTIAAAWIPARSAARIEPALAMQKGKRFSIPPVENRYRVLIAGAALALALAATLRASSTFLYLGLALVAASAVLLSPILTALVARAIRGPLRLLFPVEGALAVDSLLQTPRRTSATVAALMLSIAATIGMAGAAQATVASIDQWVTTSFNGDLLVSTAESLNARSFHFPGSMLQELQSLAIVEEVQPVRTVQVPLDGQPVVVVGLDVAMAERRSPSRRFPVGDVAEMHRLTANGQGLIVSENLWLLRKLRLGDELVLTTPGGPLRLPVVGVIRDFTNQTGSVYIDLRVFRQYWRDDSLDLFSIYLRRGVDAAAAKRQILASFQSERRLFVFLNTELRRFVLDLGSQWFGLTNIQVGIAILVAVLGVMNALTVSIIDRRRELGVLRAVGGIRNQIRRTLWLEAMAIATVGVVLGVSLGAVTLYYEIEIARRSVLATALDYIFPLRVALTLAPTMLAVALVSAMPPAEAAVRESLVEALEYE